MKKMMKYAAAMACMALMSLTLASCGSDDDSPAPPPSVTKTLKTSTWDITFTQSAESAQYVQVFPLKVCYYDAAGALQVETVTGTSWNKSVAYQGEKSNKGFVGVRMIEPGNVQNLDDETSYPIGLEVSGKLTNVYDDGSQDVYVVGQNPYAYFSGAHLGSFQGAGFKDKVQRGWNYINYLGKFELHEGDAVRMTTGLTEAAMTKLRLTSPANSN